MEAKILHIEDRAKKGNLGFTSLGEFGPSRLDDFHYREDGTVDAQVIVDDPQVTLYCLDDDTRQAIFVELPRNFDLYAEPFMYRPQFQHAQRLLAIPYEGLHELADRMGTRFRRLILMNTTGRSGGTLMSRALNRVDSVLSLDEPDVYHEAVLMRSRDGARDEELTRLLHSATLLSFKPTRSGVDTLFVKYRYCCIQVGDLMYKAFPEARVLFLYRNAEAWVRSAARGIQSVLSSEDGVHAGDAFMEFFRHLDDPQQVWPVEPPKLNGMANRGEPQREANLGATFPLMVASIGRFVRSQMKPRDRLALLWLWLMRQVPGLRGGYCRPLEYVRPYIEAFPPVKLLALVWVSVVHRYLELQAQGIPMLAVQYETMVADPDTALRAIFEYCGLPAGRVDVAKEAFGEDSQKGTPISRDRVRAQQRNLPQKYLDEVREVLREHPPTVTADFVAPGSLDLGTLQRLPASD